MIDLYFNEIFLHIRKLYFNCIGIRKLYFLQKFLYCFEVQFSLITQEGKLKLKTFLKFSFV